VNIVLASGSPRRKELLMKFIKDFKIQISDIEEDMTTYNDVNSLVMKLAFEKGADVLNRCEDDEIIISADTIVVYNNEVLGKPHSEEDARAMLEKLSNNYHEVITGICIMKKEGNIKILDYETTRVKMKKLDKNEIEDYIKTGEPMDKAGAYGIQGLGSIFVESIEGDYYNVMGLPLNKLYSYLLKYFDISLLNTK
jgi:septum formation protein